MIDVGSNAIRLVVYGGPPRAPLAIYNEKARIALGEGVARNGRISQESMVEAVNALNRFHTITEAMGVGQLRAVATAATRTASNGADLIGRAAAIGLNLELLSGELEARAAAMGVLCDSPWVDGYVADLGGGSLELARVKGCDATPLCSLPLGTIPLSRRKDLSIKSLAREIEDGLTQARAAQLEPGLPLYLVGGSWRALGQLHILHSAQPLHILSNHSIAAEELTHLRVPADDAKMLTDTGVVAASRIASLPAALMAAEALARLLQAKRLVVSVHGLREGLLFEALPEDVRTQDPLIAAARYEGSRLSRFAYHGDGIANWIAPLFSDTPGNQLRLRHAACLLADCAWNGNPEYRGEIAAEFALEGNWPGVDRTDRAVIAAALYAVYEGKRTPPNWLTELAPIALLERAKLWGMAIRLAQRIDGGTGVGLEGVKAHAHDGSPEIDIAPGFEAFDSPIVRRRLRQLVDAYSV